MQCNGVTEEDFILHSVRVLRWSPSDCQERGSEAAINILNEAGLRLSITPLGLLASELPAQIDLFRLSSDIE